MNEITSFEHEAFGLVRTVMKDDEPWFVGMDVTRALGYAKPHNAILAHCKKSSKITHNPDSGSVKRPPVNLAIIPESDVYRLIMRSNLPKAARFQDWVCDEVLPSIRKHGGYLTPAKLEEALNDPDTLIQLATNLKHERQKRLEAEAQIEVDKPKVIFADSIEASSDTILIRDLAKLIHQSTDYKTGERRLFEWLRGNGYLIKSGSDRNLPTQRSMELGLFEVRERTRLTSDGSRLVRTTKVTGKGQTYFINKFKQ